MRFVFLNLALIAQAHGAVLPRNVPPQVTPPPVLHHKREPTATVIVGPVSEYLKPAPSAPTVTGHDFTLIPGATPSDGYDFYLGPDIRIELNDAVRKNCDKPPEPQCITSINKIIRPEELELQRRQFGIFYTTGPGGLLPIEFSPIMLANATDGVPEHIHVPGTDVTQLQAASTASAVAFATATNDPNPIILNITPVDPIDPGSVVNAENGDLSINLPQDFATRLNDLIAQEGGCVGSRDLNDALLSCLVATTGAVMENVVEGPAASLILLHGTFRPPANAALLGALNQIIQNGATVKRALGLAQDQFNTLADAAFWLTYAKLVLHETVGTSTTIDEHELGEDKNGVSCPPTDRTPLCSNCGGNQGEDINKCKGLRRLKDLWIDCNCINDKIIPSSHFKGTRQEFLDSHKALENLPKLPITPSQPVPTPVCATTRMNVETNLFKSLITTFCKNNPGDISKDTSASLTNKDASGTWTSYDNWTFKFGFADKPGECAQPCEELYTNFVRDTQCSYDSHTMASNGSVSQPCGIAEFSIAKPPETPTAPKPTPTNTSPSPYERGTCSLKLTQWNNKGGIPFDSGPGYGASQYSVSVTISDNGGKSIGSSTRKDAGDKNPLSISSKLESPLIITPEERGDYVQFSLPGQVWPSNNKKGDPRAKCDVGSWKGGVQRDMSCTFACG